LGPEWLRGQSKGKCRLGQKSSSWNFMTAKHFSMQEDLDWTVVPM
jgi:hypothetical protein